MNPNWHLPASVMKATLLVALAGVVGCQDTGPKNTEFFGHDETQSVTTTLDRQASNGARHDGMLREQHFDGTRLNALGRWKLDRMLAQPGPVAVYLSGPSDKATAESRRQAILAYAKDDGRSETDVSVIDGINPATCHLAAPELARMPKTELGQTSANGSTPADASMNSTDLGLTGNISPATAGSTTKGGS